jgi:hypothetical protein
MRIPNKFNGYSADNRRLYNDPITMAMVGAAAGAALKPNDPLRGAMLGATVGFTGGTALGIGAGTTAAGAAGSGLTASGSALGGSLGSSAAAGTSATLGANAANAAKLGIETTGLSTGVGSASAGTMGAGTGLSIAPTTIGSASNVSSIASAKSAADAASAASTAPEWFGLNAMTKTPGGLSVAPASTSLTAPVGQAANYSLTASPTVAPGFNYTIPERFGMAGKSAYENPMMTVQALNATQGLLDPGQQPPSAPAVPIQARGQLKPYDAMALMNPYKESVISNQPISLLG